jgi:hypothetical protein
MPRNKKQLVEMAQGAQKAVAYSTRGSLAAVACVHTSGPKPGFANTTRKQHTLA